MSRKLTPEEVNELYKISDALQAELLYKLGNVESRPEITELIGKIEKCVDVAELLGYAKDSIEFLIPTT